MSSKTSLTGAAGEHYVMFRLLSFGLIGAMAPEGVPNMDIVVTSIDGHQLSALQVKTRWAKGSDGGWHMSRKHETIKQDRLFYCFVDLGNEFGGTPECFVVPSHVVAAAIHKSHEHWLSRPGKKGQTRNDSKLRRFLPDYGRVFEDIENPYPKGWLDQYREAWASLL